MSSERFGALCALVLAILFLASLALLDLPGHDDDEGNLNAFYGDGGDRIRVIVGSYCLALAGVALIGLSAILSVRAERAGAPLLGRLIVAAAVASGVLLMAAAAAQAPTYALSISAFDEPESELTRATIPHMGWSLLLFSMLASAAFCASVSAAIRATGMLPRWLAWVGFVAAALLPFSIIFMPIFALPLWAVVVAVALWRAA